MKHPNEKIMRELIRYAIKHGNYNQRTACFIIKGNKIISKTMSAVGINKDPTAHAEINALSKLCRKQKSYYIRGCWVYSTQIPCPMCTSAIVWAEAKGIVYGWDGRHMWGKLNIDPRKIIKTAKNKIWIFGPFLEQECLKIRGYTRRKK